MLRGPPELVLLSLGLHFSPLPRFSQLFRCGLEEEEGGGEGRMGRILRVREGGGGRSRKGEEMGVRNDKFKCSPSGRRKKTYVFTRYRPREFIMTSSCIYPQQIRNNETQIQY